MTVESMTGFAVASEGFAGGTLQLELKGVNSRFLDMHFKIADDLRQYEALIREQLMARLGRGKVECRLYYALAQTQAGEVALNEANLAELVALQSLVQSRLPQAASLSTGEVLRWPGVLSQHEVDFSQLSGPVSQALKLALGDFVASREREGAKLVEMLTQRVARMREIVRTVEPLLPQAQQAYADRLRQKMQELMATADEDRICQEVAVYATRIDVAEELSRLQAHLDEVERVLRKGGAVGKRLDFLMQELNREANTLGSKSVVTEVSQAAMELKLLIEQMREQVQNLA